MGIAAIIIAVLDVIVCILLVVMVIFQDSKSKGLGAISGGAETFFGKTKKSGKDALMKRLTEILAIIFVILTVTLNIITNHA